MVNEYDESRVGFKSDKGPVRANNQDACFTPGQSETALPLHLGVLYIVADGVGGQKHGADAARLAVQIIRDLFYQAREEGTEIQPALKAAIHRANQAIYKEAEERGGDRMGSTVVVAVQEGGKLYVAHVGDARAYLLHQNELRRMTRDDTWVQKQVEAGVLTPEEAANHELRNVVTQVLGNKPEIQVHLAKPYALAGGDVLLLCSDGLHDPVSSAEIEEILRGNDPQAAANALVGRAIEKGASDNITAVVVHSGEKGANAVAAPAPASSLSNLPGWAWLLGIVFVLILALAILVPRLFGGESGERIDEEIAGVVPTRSEVANVPAVAATATPLAAATSTVAPTPTNTAVPTLTPPPSPTRIPRACITVDQTLLWSDAQVNGPCGATTDQSLSLDTTVLLLSEEPQTFNGPDTACAPAQFSNVRTLEENPREGWVFTNNLAFPLPEGATCPLP